MTPLPTPNQFGPSPLLPLGSAHPNPILISTYKNRKGIHNTYGVDCSLSFLPPGSGLLSGLSLQPMSALSRSQTPFVEKIAFATGILVLKLKGAGKAVSPSKWAESVIARCCGQKLGSRPGNPSKVRVCGTCWRLVTYWSCGQRPPLCKANISRNQ